MKRLIGAVFIGVVGLAAAPQADAQVPLAGPAFVASQITLPVTQQIQRRVKCNIGNDSNGQPIIVAANDGCGPVGLTVDNPVVNGQVIIVINAAMQGDQLVMFAQSPPTGVNITLPTTILVHVTIPDSQNSMLNDEAVFAVTVTNGTPDTQPNFPIFFDPESSAITNPIQNSATQASVLN
jgi:hypothetical protein